MTPALNAEARYFCTHPRLMLTPSVSMYSFASWVH